VRNNWELRECRATTEREFQQLGAQQIERRTRGAAASELVHLVSVDGVT